MEFTRKLLESLEDSGKGVCVYSNTISEFLKKDYKWNSFQNFSSRLYYYWKDGKKAIPIGIVIKILRDKKLNKIDLDYFSVSSGNKVKFPDEMNLKFCYLLGLILGDGCLIHRKRGDNRNTYLIHISFKDKGDAEKSKIVIKELFNLSSNIHLGRGCYVLMAHSKPVVMILNKKYQIPLGLKYKFICVPDLIKKGNKEMKKSFVKGVFDSDGNIYFHRNNKCIQLRQRSRNFLDEIRDLLVSIKLEFRNPYYDRANNSWLLWSSKKDLVVNFIKEIIDFKIG